jgi:hypothetical protein
MTHWARLAVILAALFVGAGPLVAVPTASSTALAVQVTPSSDRPVTGLLSLLGGALAVFGAIKVKDAGAIAQKYSARASAAAGDYKAGVQSAGSDWEAGARAGETNFEQGVQEAIAKKRYGRGIAAAGAQKYVDNATNLGAARYPQGVQQAVPAFTKGITPVLDKLRSLNLPPKGPKRSPQNQQRAAMVAMELGKMKDGQ